MLTRSSGVGWKGPSIEQKTRKIQKMLTAHFAYAYEDFRTERDTMPAIVLDLKDIGYRCPGVIETQYTAVENPRAWEGAYTSAFEQLHPNESERAEALAKIQKCEQETDWHPPGLLENLGDLEQLLLEARAFCLEAQKRPRWPAIPMTAEDGLILATLAEAFPEAVNQPELEGLTGLSHQIISDRLKWLESKPRRYVVRPEGTKRKGHAITPAGLSAIGRPVESPH